MIVDKKTGELFDIPKQVSISIEQVSPVDMSEGSVSLPFSLPYTPKNLRLLGNPHRLDNATKPAQTSDVLVIVGFFQREGTLTVLSVKKEQSIEVSVSIAESVFLYKANRTTMPDLFKGVVRDEYYDAGDVDGSRTMWINHFDEVMRGARSDEFKVFEVLCKDSITNLEYDSLNELSTPQYFGSGDVYASFLNSSYDRQIRIDYNGNPVSLNVLKGHNVTPFLKLLYVLNKTFNLLGFSLDDRDIYDDYRYTEACVLNNTADAILTGKIYYYQLVPTCTVAQFLKAVCVTFGGIFVTTGSTVKFSLWSNIININNKPLQDLSPYVSAHPTIRPVEKMSLKLGAKSGRVEMNLRKDIDHAFFQKVESKHQIGALYDVSTYLNPIFVERENCLYLVNRPNDFLARLNYTHAQLGDSQNPISSDDRNPTLEAYYNALTNSQRHYLECTIRPFQNGIKEEYASNASAGKYKPVTCDMRLLSDISFEALNPTSNVSESYTTRNTKHVAKVFIGEIRRLNSSITITGQAEITSSNQECPIMFAFQNQVTYEIDDGQSYNYYVHFYGATNKVILTANGIKEISIDLGGEFGIYNTYWTKYNEMLERSNFEIETNMDIPTHVYASLDLSKPVLVNGQPVIINSTKYEVNQDGLKFNEVKLKTIRSYNTE